MTTVKQNWLRLPKSVRQLFLKKGVDEDSIPHDRTWDLWKVVGEDCGLSHGQTMKIINFLFTSTEVQFDDIIANITTEIDSLNLQPSPPLQPPSDPLSRMALDVKTWILHATIVDHFVSGPQGGAWPVSAKGSIGYRPHQLLLRSFHQDVAMLAEHVLMDKRQRGCVFFGPSGIGKSWSANFLLMTFLKTFHQPGTVHRSVVYFDSAGRTAWIFGKTRTTTILQIDTPGEVIIPELRESDTILIFDASRGTINPLCLLPCMYFIFSSPQGNFGQVADILALTHYVCPNWTRAELILLAKGDIDEGEVETRYNMFGGSPRLVVASEYENSVASVNKLMGELENYRMPTSQKPAHQEWPSSLLRAWYADEVTAEEEPEVSGTQHTPGLKVGGESDGASVPECAALPTLKLNDADDLLRRAERQPVHKKYHTNNVRYAFCSPHLEARMMEQLQKYSDAERKTFIENFEGNPMLAAARGYLHENDVASLKWASAKAQVRVLTQNGRDDKVFIQTVQESLSKDPAAELWTLPRIERCDTIGVGFGKELASLLRLTDPAVIYRLPSGFPLMDFFVPPNNCFSAAVGRHYINLKQAMELAKVLIRPGVTHVNFLLTRPPDQFAEQQYMQSFQVDTMADDTGEKPVRIYESRTLTMSKLKPELRQAMLQLRQYCITLSD